MTTVFDGMAGVLNATFGAPVTITPALGTSVTVRGVFRDDPLAVTAADGRPIWIEVPTLRVPRNAGVPLAVGSVVEPSSWPTRRFRILSPVAPGSPASDAFVVCELEEIL